MTTTTTTHSSEVSTIDSSAPPAVEAPGSNLYNLMDTFIEEIQIQNVQNVDVDVVQNVDVVTNEVSNSTTIVPNCTNFSELTTTTSNIDWLISNPQASTSKRQASSLLEHPDLKRQRIDENNSEAYHVDRFYKFVETLNVVANILKNKQ